MIHTAFPPIAPEPQPKRRHILETTLFNVALICAVIAALLALAYGIGWMFVLGANMSAAATCGITPNLWC